MIRPMSVPELWIVAGPNGAGKTTLTQRKPISDLLPDVHLLNPDDKALEILRRQGYAGFAHVPADVLRASFHQAAAWVTDRLDWRLRRMECVCVETVLSTDKYRAVVEQVGRAGGFVALIYVALRTPDLACRRVAARVQAGGHDVPVDRVVERWHRSLQQLSWFARHVHRFWVFDNSDSDPARPPALLAEGGSGQVIIQNAEAIPELAKSLRDFPEPTGQAGGADAP